MLRSARRRRARGGRDAASTLSGLSGATLSSSTDSSELGGGGGGARILRPIPVRLLPPLSAEGVAKTYRAVTTLAMRFDELRAEGRWLEDECDAALRRAPTEHALLPGQVVLTEC